MGCRGFSPWVLIARIVLLFVCLSSLSLIALPGGTAAVEERTPVRGEHPSLARDQQGEPAEVVGVVADRLAAAFPRVEGLVIGFAGDLVLIDRGTAHGVFQGMELDVFRAGEEFKRPFTGEILGRLDKDLGRVRALHVRERYAEATVIKKIEKTGFRKGDRVRVSMARMIVAFPNVDVEGISGAGARSMTKELAAALVRTGRFELVEERQLRSMLLADKEFRAGELADPRILKQLADRGKIQILLLSRLTRSADGVSLDVQAYSTLTGNSIILASALVQPGMLAHDKLPRGVQPPPAARAAVTTPPETGKPAATSSAASSGPPVASTAPEHVVLEPRLDGSMTAMTVADLDGDGKSELLVAGADRLFVFRFDGSHLGSLTEYPLSGKDTVATLEAMDVTGNGRAAVVMTLSRKGRFHALVLQWADGRLRPIWEMPDLVLRSLSPNGKTSQLFGQTAMPGDRATKPIHQYTWDGRNFRAGPVLDVPADLALLDVMLADLGGDEAARLITFKEGATLEIRSRTGEPISTYNGGGVTTLTHRAGSRVLIENEGDRARPHIILGREEEAEARLFGRWTGSKAVSVIVLTWDGARFHEVRQMPITDGTLADYAVADLGEGLGRRLLALVVKKGRFGWSTKSEVHAFRFR